MDVFTQLRVVAMDGGTPPRSSTATVVFTINRNLFAPSFNPQTIERNILENFQLGVLVADVNATDQDTKVRRSPVFKWVLLRTCRCYNALTFHIPPF